MGKYMRKGKGVGKVAVMEVSQGSLGVRTRARALALQNDRNLAHTSGESLKHPLQSECNESADNYMELRSRRLEKVARCSIVRDDDVTQASRGVRKATSECSRPSHLSNSDMSAEESSRLRLPNTSRATHGLPRLAAAAGSDGSRTRAAQLSLQSSGKGSVSTGVIPRRVTPTASGQSRSNSVSIPQRQPPGILTRNQRQELANSTSQEGMEVDAEAFSIRSGPSRRGRNVEVEPFFGESPMMAGPAMKDSQGPGSRRCNRENTPDSYIPDVEAPGSTSRTRRPRRGRGQGRSLSAPPFGRATEAPSSSEIEAFFEGAEQQERRRFIDRYNFDPANDRPLRGRYEWVSL